MMKKGLLLIVCIGVLVSCSKEENISSKSLNGNWYMQEALCYCGFDPNEDFSKHVLSFSDADKTLKITSPDNLWLLGENGTYNFSIKNDILKITSINDYRFEIDGNTLTMTKIDDPMTADDELKLIYTR